MLPRIALRGECRLSVHGHDNCHAFVVPRIVFGHAWIAARYTRSPSMNRAHLRLHSRGILIEQVPSLGVALGRYGLGGVLFGGGTWFLWLVLEGPWSYYLDGGFAALPEALPGMFVSALLATLLLPLGFWMLFMRTRWRIDLPSRTLVDEVDWRIGRRATTYLIADYQSLWLGEAELAPSTAKRRGPATLAICLQAMPLRAEDTATLCLAWFDLAAKETSRALADRVSQSIGLPLHVEGEDVTPPAPPHSAAH